MAAIGARAAWITGEHPDDDGYGPRSPFARLVEADGQVLMLGAPLDTVTLLHHAEAVARVPGKRTVTYRVTLAGDGGPREHTYTDIDTSLGAFPDDTLALEEDEFAVIARAALDAGIGAWHGRRRRVVPLPRPGAHGVRGRVDGGAFRVTRRRLPAAPAAALLAVLAPAPGRRGPRRQRPTGDRRRERRRPSTSTPPAGSRCPTPRARDGRTRVELRRGSLRRGLHGGPCPLDRAADRPATTSVKLDGANGQTLTAWDERTSPSPPSPC